MRASFFLRALPAPMPATAPMAEPAAMEGRTRPAVASMLAFPCCMTASAWKSPRLATSCPAQRMMRSGTMVTSVKSFQVAIPVTRPTRRTVVMLAVTPQPLVPKPPTSKAPPWASKKGISKAPMKRE